MHRDLSPVFLSKHDSDGKEEARGKREEPVIPPLIVIYAHKQPPKLKAVYSILVQMTVILTRDILVASDHRPQL